MRHSLFFLLPLFALCAATMYAQPSATYPRTMFVTYNGAPVYDSASYISTVLAELRKGDSVHVLGVSGKYYRIIHGDREGFLLWSNVAAERPKDRGGASGEGRKKEKKENAVSSAASEQPKSGKREIKGTQCRATTKSGGQCSRSTNDPSGYCWQHNR